MLIEENRNNTGKWHDYKYHSNEIGIVVGSDVTEMAQTEMHLGISACLASRDGISVLVFLTEISGPEMVILWPSIYCFL
jgi:hypothetical protein